MVYASNKFGFTHFVPLAVQGRHLWKRRLDRAPCASDRNLRKSFDQSERCLILEASVINFWKINLWFYFSYSKTQKSLHSHRTCRPSLDGLQNLENSGIIKTTISWKFDRFYTFFCIIIKQIIFLNLIYKLDIF